VLLNVVIPLTCGIFLVRRHYRKAFVRAVMICLLCLFGYQTFLWSIGVFLPVNATKLGFYQAQSMSLFDFMFSRSLQQSVAHLAAIGTAISAIINGFASVNFPLEQIMITTGVDFRVLQAREKALRQVLQGIVDRKKKITLEVFNVLNDKLDDKLMSPELPMTNSLGDNRLNKTRISSMFR
jgi:The Golgi pH Regulator (GPHR) Family N-terminal